MGGEESHILRFTPLGQIPCDGSVVLILEEWSFGETLFEDENDPTSYPPDGI
jgi:hypothetical protein